MQTLDHTIYQYKYIVDGSWLCDPEAPQTRDAQGNLNNVLDLSQTPVKLAVEIGTLKPELQIPPPSTPAPMCPTTFLGFIPTQCPSI